jgi:hypothetical protein
MVMRMRKEMTLLSGLVCFGEFVCAGRLVM